MLCQLASVSIRGERLYIADTVLGRETPLTPQKDKAFVFALGAASYYAAQARFPHDACALRIETQICDAPMAPRQAEAMSAVKPKTIWQRVKLLFN